MITFYVNFRVHCWSLVTYIIVQVRRHIFLYNGGVLSKQLFMLSYNLLIIWFWMNISSTIIFLDYCTWLFCYIYAFWNMNPVLFSLIGGRSAADAFSRLEGNHLCNWIKFAFLLAWHHMTKLLGSFPISNGTDVKTAIRVFVIRKRIKKIKRRDCN